MASSGPAPPNLAAGEYFSLGSHSRNITTASGDATIWFDRGLKWSYAFNREEAVACFQRARKADAKCAMAHWGIAYALGPNYNKPWESFGQIELADTIKHASRACREALRLLKDGEKDGEKAVERALIKALAKRYRVKARRPSMSDMRSCNQSYAEAMLAVYRSFPEDLDVATLYADALINVRPWSLWSIRTGKPTKNWHTREIQRVLEAALAQPHGMQHPGLLHLHIHLMEMSSMPEAALPYADALQNLLLDAGHLQNMPSHIYILCGQYMRAMHAAKAATEAHARFFALHGNEPLSYSLYRAHNLHCCIYAALFLGKSEIALQSMDELEAALPERLLRAHDPPMADWLEGFLTLRVQILIRFGMWNALLKLKHPDDQNLYCSLDAMVHYGKGVAFAAKGDVDQAEQWQSAFRLSAGRVSGTRTVFNNKMVDVIKIADAVLDGELKYRRGKYKSAFRSLRKAIRLENILSYAEPWGWMLPTRHMYGALLLKRRHFEHAEKVYKADLGLDGDDTSSGPAQDGKPSDARLRRAMLHPNNVWSLRGYYESLIRQGKSNEAAAISPQMEKAMKTADVTVEASYAFRQEKKYAAT